jgi:hypothetical protein
MWLRISADHTSSEHTPLGTPSLHALKFTEPYEATASGFLYGTLCEVMSSTACITLAEKEGQNFLVAAKPARCVKLPAGQTTPEGLAEKPVLSEIDTIPWMAFV